jgi:putative ABC transport system substrate-binding protein
LWPLAARAQQPAVPVIGYLTLGAPEVRALDVAAFRKGLNENGFVEGRNVAIEYRWAQNQLNRLPEMLDDLIRRRVAVIVTPGNAATLAAKSATTTIPIVFNTGGDPVQNGLVASLNRPGANITGVANLAAELGGKRLALLHELLPSATRFALLVNPTSPNTKSIVAETQAAAASIGRQVEVLTASTIADIETAFASLTQNGPDALLVSANTFLGDRYVQLVTLAAHHRLPAIYSTRKFAEVGGLVTYGPSLTEPMYQTGILTGRILKGEKPADLPIIQSAKFDLVINLTTAKALGLTVPETLLATADEVIQ